MRAKPYLKEISLKRDQVPSFEKYPFNIPAVKELQTLEFHEDVTFFVGENGSGKSTLIEAIALSLGFGPEGGPKSIQLKTHENSSPLFEYLKLVKSFRKPDDYYFLRAESFYNVATYMDELNDPAYLRSYQVSSLHGCSHGESFMATINKKLKGRGLYIFDEPEAALSPSRQMATLSAIHKLVEKQSQLLIATHSPILLAYPNATIYNLDDKGIRPVKYEESEQYKLTKHFLNDYRHQVRMLLQES